MFNVGLCFYMWKSVRIKVNIFVKHKDSSLNEILESGAEMLVFEHTKKTDTF